MKHIKTRLVALLTLLALLLSVCTLAAAAANEETTAPAAAVESETAGTADAAADASANSAVDASVKTTKAWSAGMVIAVAAAVGALAMGLVIMKTVSSIARQPEAGESIRSGMMLGLVFIETAIIYALIVAILIVFVL